LNDFFKKEVNNIYYKIVFTDNNSNDNSKNIIIDSIKDLENFEYNYIAQQGKGVAIKKTWENYLSDYDIFIFLDADLATDLQAFHEVVKGMESNDLVIGDRFHSESNVIRTKKRLLISKMYRLVINKILKSKISDFPCGFKAVNKKVIESILPNVQNNTWFFDSELVYIAEKNKYKIKQIPVNWKDPRSKINKSKVNIFKVSLEYLKEIIRLKNTQ